MKDQYFGDVNDFQKYALLRRIARPASLKLGVCWMLTESDGRSDGRHLDYLNHPARFRAHDPELFDWLRVAICHDHDRRTATVAKTAPSLPWFARGRPGAYVGRPGSF